MSLALEVRSVPLRIVGFDGRSTGGRLFLRSVGESGRAETVADRLNDPGTRFLPIEIGPRVELVSLSWVAYAACAGREPEVARREEVGASRQTVELELAGGATLAGEFLHVLPRAQARVSDLLNRSDERFLMLLAPEETLFVQRAAIVRVRTG